jgi:hypothetical protein
MTAAVPMLRHDFHQPQVRFMDQGGGLQRLPGVPRALTPDRSQEVAALARQFPFFLAKNGEGNRHYMVQAEKPAARRSAAGEGAAEAGADFAPFSLNKHAHRPPYWRLDHA